MFIPLGTDAPIYHRPIATVGMMVMNVVAYFFFRGMDEETARTYVLLYGEGLHPLQWLTFNFLHAGLLHLAGNMLYLWIFGQIVEGKVGWLAFLAIYLGLGITEGGIVQVLMLGSEPGHYALGASGIIFGLVAIGMVWAPRNEVSVLLIFFYGFMIRTFQFEWSVLGFAVLYLALQILHGMTTLAIQGRFLFITELLHLLGAVLGFGLGTVLLKTALVDCEGWDLYTRGISGRSPDEKKTKARARKKVRSVSTIEDRSTAMLAGLRAALTEGETAEALAFYQGLLRMPAGWRPLEPDLRKLINALLGENLTTESVPVLEDYIDRFPEKAAKMRLRLAQVLVREQRPQRALSVLAGLADAELPADLRPLRPRLEQRARQLITDGVVELE